MPLRVGIIGTGAIGRDHSRRINNVLTGAHVSAVNDVNVEQAQKAVDDLDLKAEVFANGHELIQSNAVDAVLVTSWGPTHEEFVLSAIAAGKPVFCEKPLATTAEGCKRIVDAEIATGKRLVQVGFMRPYDSGYQLLKNALTIGEIGDPLMVHCAHRNPEVPESYVTPMAIQDTLIHELDVLRWLLDDDYVSAQVIYPRRTRFTHSKLADPQIVLLETKRGIRIDVEVFVNCKYGYDIQCSVVGELGVLNLPEPQSLLVRKEASLATNILTDWKQRFIKAYDVELQEFINGCLNSSITGPSAWDGYAASVASDACVEAQETGAIIPISMADKPSFYS
ncbi:Gfo/Idh/MocA family protein [Halioxenophilus aromaticivorans]|uniref:Inositol 2-dehydrogenase n=1 Tax=Halioxenophilus aromaticivorans TaxID=1306992 RepID=A0AAV3TVM6_9ALTE